MLLNLKFFIFAAIVFLLFTNAYELEGKPRASRRRFGLIGFGSADKMLRNGKGCVTFGHSCFGGHGKRSQKVQLDELEMENEHAAVPIYRGGTERASEEVKFPGYSYDDNQKAGTMNFLIYKLLKIIKEKNNVKNYDYSDN